MKKYIKNLFISSLLLMSPSLMAVAPSDIPMSQGQFCSDFNVVSLEKANDSEYNNLYKLTVDNNGSNFISHYGIKVFEMNESGEDIKKLIGEFACVNTDDYSKLFSDRLIRPGETPAIMYDVKVKDKYICTIDCSYSVQVYTVGDVCLDISRAYELNKINDDHIKVIIKNAKEQGLRK